MEPSSLEDFKVEHNVPLANYTTFRLGGRCPALYSCQAPNQLDGIVKKLARENQPFILIGGGSNIVVSDKGVNCAVVRYVSDSPLIEQEGNDFVVSGSTNLDDLALIAAERGLEGLNCTTGIPGTVGGAIVGNAGAFGKQIGDVLTSVSLLDKKGNQTDVSAESLDFSYRYSSLKERGLIVVSARLTLKPGDKKVLLGERKEIIALRKSKHPDLECDPCAGSFFRNIEPTSAAGKRQAAGWFLDQAGAKRLKIGGAHIFNKHANIIIKGESCTAQNVFELSKKMKKLVKEKFDLDLIREVKFVGEFAGKPENRSDFIW